ncbi:MAG: hypothetical protein JST32_20845, partial [Bacteroidetes bacterium]|nr:hypothetical protein [Bacteroidota bacterium]
MTAKRVLIISPYFPPSNAADMQRIRMSLPYFLEFGWEAEVVTVDPGHSEMIKDPLLEETVQDGITVHVIGAFPKKWTSLVGLGSLGLRSMYHYFKKVNSLLAGSRYQLIYFSTTQFVVCTLGTYWKKRFGIPYVIDMQDPWHSEYYRDKPRQQRPRKYWFSYRMNKWTEPVAMRSAGGLISVSAKYLSDLCRRYPRLRHVPSATITFGAFEPDMRLAARHTNDFSNLLEPGRTNLVYAGRGGADMEKSVSALFRALRDGNLQEPEYFKRIHLYFIGTSYAPEGEGKPTILPVARAFAVEGQVTEMTGRISYYHTLVTLRQADALLMPGSDDPGYTASKIFPYMLAGKPLLAIFNPGSPAIPVLKEYGAEHVYGYGPGSEAGI